MDVPCYWLLAGRVCVTDDPAANYLQSSASITSPADGAGSPHTLLTEASGPETDAGQELDLTRLLRGQICSFPPA